MDINILILNWYAANLRDLPWRKNKNPYSIWLSEVILQQTQVIQGLPYYENFMKNFPEVADLAEAEEEKVLKLWQGLGYYSRARNLHAAAKYIIAELDGQFPTNYKDLLNLKGVGDYTAAAIASIAFNEVVPTIDGNVLRVISRLFDVDLPVDSSAGKNAIREYMLELIDQKNPGDFNQAVMELGAKVCKPKNPDCVNCPLIDKCIAFEKGTFLERPVKVKKVKVEDVYIDYLLLLSPKGIVMQQRDDKGIWKNLFELPNVSASTEFTSIKGLEYIRDYFSDHNESIALHQTVKHKLTHRNLTIRFFRCKLKQDPVNSFVLFENILEKAVPKPIENYLNDHLK